MMNEHVYKYWRWRGWIAEQAGFQWSSFLAYGAARQEREAQGETKDLSNL